MGRVTGAGRHGGGRRGEVAAPGPAQGPRRRAVPTGSSGARWRATSGHVYGSRNRSEGPRVTSSSFYANLKKVFVINEKNPGSVGKDGPFPGHFLPRPPDAAAPAPASQRADPLRPPRCSRSHSLTLTLTLTRVLLHPVGCEDGPEGTMPRCRLGQMRFLIHYSTEGTRAPWRHG